MTFTVDLLLHHDGLPLIELFPILLPSRNGNALSNCELSLRIAALVDESDLGTLCLFMIASAVSGSLIFLPMMAMSSETSLEFQIGWERSSLVCGCERKNEKSLVTIGHIYGQRVNSPQKL